MLSLTKYSAEFVFEKNREKLLCYMPSQYLEFTLNFTSYTSLQFIMKYVNNFSINRIITHKI